MMENETIKIDKCHMLYYDRAKGRMLQFMKLLIKSLGEGVVLIPVDEIKANKILKHLNELNIKAKMIKANNPRGEFTSGEKYEAESGYLFYLTPPPTS